MTDQKESPAVVLVGAEDARWARMVQEVLGAQGFQVLRTQGVAALLEAGRVTRPDAILFEDRLSGRAGAEVCRTLRQQPWLTPATPILITSHSPLGSAEHARALEAGAWDVLRRATAPQELAHRVRNYVAAKREADRARAASLVDPGTGLYNAEGLKRRCEELTADAFRRHAALACLAVTADLERGGQVSEAHVDTLGQLLTRLLRETVRKSDVLGRHGPLDFIVIAPRTDPRGADGMARRLTRLVNQPEWCPDPACRLGIGYDAVPNVREMATDPTKLLTSALEAAWRARDSAGADPVQPFRPFEHRRPPAALA